MLRLRSLEQLLLVDHHATLGMDEQLGEHLTPNLQVTAVEVKQLFLR